VPRRIGSVVLALAGVALAIQLSGCGGKDYKCESIQLVCGKSAQVCCPDKGDCYATYGGRQYPCNGTDCYDAGVQIGLAMCTNSPGALNASTQKAGEALQQTAGELATKAKGTRCPVCP
jgi:hypothetical protein